MPRDEASGYRGAHRAADRDSGSPMHDVIGTWPPDIYGPNGAAWYGHGSDESRPLDERMVSLLRRLRGHPDARVAVYRAVPSDAERVIHPGDWVTPIREYAERHGESNLLGDYTIVQLEARAGDLFSGGESIHEWGWSPSPEASALDALERARRAQEVHDRRVDVQLRLGLR